MGIGAYHVTGRKIQKIMRIVPLKIILIMLLLTMRILAQPPQSFTVTTLEGTAKVQHSEQYEWGKVSVGDVIQSSDLIETNFQTKLRVQYAENIVILGSNSKALIDYRIKASSDSTRVELNVTLFSGGVLTKLGPGCNLKVFTTNAVAETDSGSFSTVSDAKTGETGVQVISGEVNVRNINQNKGKSLRSGLTTMVLPNKEPTASLYMTNRHVTVLKNFFGDEYIQAELDISGVKPTEEKSGNRLSFSQNFSSKSTSTTNDDLYRALFNMEKIYGSIIDDQLSNSRFYIPFSKSSNVVKKRGRMELGTNTGVCDSRVLSAYVLSFAYNYKFIDGGLRFSLDEQGPKSHRGMNFTTAQGLADKLDHLTIGSYPDSIFVELGPINSLTLGRGLVVDNFRNAHPGNIYNAVGVNAQARFFSEIAIKGFLNDIVNPYIGGACFSYEPSSYYIGAGYYFDIDQHKSFVNKDNYSYSSPSIVDLINPGSRNAPVHIYEIDLGTDLIISYELQAKLFCEFAQKINSGNDGMIIKIPSFTFDFNRTSLGLSLVVESGRLISSQFDPFYLTQRSFIKYDADRDTTTLESVNSILSPDRSALGVSFTYNVNPIKGIDVALSYKQNFKERNTFVVGTDTTDSSSAARLDYSYSVRCAINDSLLRFVKYAGVYVNQTHGTLFPATGKPFLSWNSEAGAEIQTNPLIFNIAIETRLRYFYLDNGRNPNNFINDQDHIIEWYFGIKWGFI